jgi:hypothetical protein
MRADMRLRVRAVVTSVCSPGRNTSRVITHFGNLAQNVGPDDEILRPRERRFPCVPTAALVRLDGKVEDRPVSVRDVSKSGLRLTLQEYIPVGSRVAIELANLVVTGEIRFCRQAENESFAAGLKITDVIKARE